MYSVPYAEIFTDDDDNYDYLGHTYINYDCNDYPCFADDYPFLWD